MKIIQAFITKDDSYRNNVNKADSRYTNFQQRGPLGLMLHSVGCNQPSAKSFADRWNQPGREASVHAVLQADGTVYQVMPWNFRAWHCGGAANDTHVGVEMTEPGCIHYTTGAKFTCDNLEEAQAQVRGTYNTAVELFAMLCKQYKLDPMKDIISHYEGSKKGVASDHGDPEHLWKGLNMGYTMNGFRHDVKEYMEDEMTREETKKLIEEAKEEAIKSANEAAEVKIKEALDDALGPMIGNYTEIKWKGVREEVGEMVRLGVIDGGTDKAVNPNDVNMRLQDLRVLVVAKRYIVNKIADKFKIVGKILKR